MPSLLSDLKKHHVHWFVGALVLLYAVSVAAGVDPAPIGSVPHAAVPDEEDEQ